MRIGINALYLLPGRVGGSEVYLRNLVRKLSELDTGNEYLVFINRETRGVFENIAPGVRTVPCPINAVNRPLRILWEQFLLPIQARRHGIDVLLSAGMTAPILCPVPSALVIYDLQHKLMPENFPKLYLQFLKAIIYLSARSADRIITLSEKSKGDITRFYRVPPELVTVTHLASDKAVFFRRSPEETRRVREKYGLPERFVLYIASSLPHKNYERLLSAYKTVARETDTKLVLTGARDYGAEEIKKKIREEGLENDVVFLGWLPFEDLPPLYSAAELFVFPSLHEGFGIPVLEAFACGTPVVASGIEVLREVAGSAALFVDPHDVNSIGEGMLTALRDRTLRERLVGEGLKRAAEFSWEKTALSTLSVISSLVDQKAPPEASSGAEECYPKITVITPTLNQGRFIERTIRSVLDQRYPNLEYIVVDGGSIDNTLEVLKKYEGSLRWISEKDRGQADAINKGIRMSSGEIIAYLNSDDLYEKGALMKVARFFRENPSRMWLTGKCRIIDEKDGEIRRPITWYKNFFLKRYSYNTLLVTNYVSQPATFIRRRAMEELGLFDASHHRVMDYDYWLRIGKKYAPGVMGDFLASFRVYRESKTSSSYTKTFREELDVSRRYSHSRALNALHYLNYIGILAVYTALDVFKRRRATAL